MREEGLVLDDVLAALRRRWVLIAFFALLGAVSASLFVRAGSDRYEATARLLLRPGDPLERLEPTGASSFRTQEEADRNVDTQIELIESPGVAEAAARRLSEEGVDIDADEVLDSTSVSQSGPTDIVDVDGTADDPAQAAAIANAVVLSYIEDRRQDAVAGLEAAQQAVERSMAEVSEDIDRLERASADEQEDRATNRSRAGLVDQLERLADRRQDLVIEIGLKRGGAELVTEATAPASVATPSLARTAAVGGAIGLLMGIGVALLRDHLDDRVRAARDLESLVDGPFVTVLSWRDLVDPLLADAPASPLPERLRSLRNTIWMMEGGYGMQRVLVAGPRPLTTTTAVSSALALSCAAAGHRTLLVGTPPTNARNGAVPALAGRPGLVEVVAEVRARNAAVAQVPTGAPGGPSAGGDRRTMGLLDVVVDGGTPNLWVLPSGLSADLSDTLVSDEFIELSAELGSMFDAVVYDGSLLSPDAQLAPRAGSVDVIALTATTGHTSRSGLRRAARVMRSASAPVSGVLVSPPRRLLPRRLA